MNNGFKFMILSLYTRYFYTYYTRYCLRPTVEKYVKYVAVIFLLLASCILRNSLGVEATKQQSGAYKLNPSLITDSLNKLHWASLSKDVNQINSFLQYYAIPEAQFYYNSELYIDYGKTPVKTQNVTLNRSEYGAYIFESVSDTINYNNIMKIANIKISDNNSAVATISFAETYQLNGDDKITISVASYTNCNIIYTYKTTALIASVNCIEKTFANKEKRNT